MQIPIYQIDAFTNTLFGGNPAAVMPLERWLPDEVLQAIAAENNLSETAFFVPTHEREDADFHIRWFTPTAEVPLCGHATQAAAWVVFNKYEWPHVKVRFQSKSGLLSVLRRPDDSLELDFPNLAYEPCSTPELIKAAMPEAPDNAFFVPNDTNYMVVLDSENAVGAAAPDLQSLSLLGNQGLIITAKGDQCDFVSRYFAPGVGIDEDPVTGSIHSVLTPYWAQQTGNSSFTARQLSKRGCDLHCELRGDRVAISGHAVFFMEGSVQLP
ncbi:PhzF family phenazine biosynthesis protein [Marinobacter sp. AL4B]|uniref:PhzF family phenazine biosynthesis protein n=1 Tax=Marinobacter sp. AL4B TaxID=2871173 RepID=UPI001CAA5F0D|nr:PhzF family phenazine biosynthesis protein [Marinobacter sp. AL4B]MBZ0334135.1 PhzF family phenazine biosynthesis protein [Marinobacter sp. AL4B]